MVTGGAGGADALIIDDTNSAPAGQYRVSVGKVERVGGPNVSNVDYVIRTLRWSQGGTEIALLGNAPDPEARLAIATGPGADRVVVSDEFAKLDGVRNQVAIDGMDAGAGGRDRLVVADTGHGGAEHFTLLDGEVDVGRLPDLLLTYTGFEDLELNAGSE